MSTTTLLKTDVKILEDVEIAQYVIAEYEKIDVQGIVEAVAAIGSLAVAKLTKTKLIEKIAVTLGEFLTYKGGISIVKDAMEETDLAKVINRMQKGDKLRVTTKVYEWQSGSGNMVTWYSEVTYSIV